MKWSAIMRHVNNLKARWDSLVERPRDVTMLLGAWSQGDQSARDQLIPLVYAELRRLAARYMSLERRGHYLQPTALVHEAYLRLVDQRQVHLQGRAHFFALA